LSLLFRRTYQEAWHSRQHPAKALQQGKVCWSFAMLMTDKHYYLTDSTRVLSHSPLLIVQPCPIRPLWQLWRNILQTLRQRLMVKMATFQTRATLLPLCCTVSWLLHLLWYMHLSTLRWILLLPRLLLCTH
jgi:hypothetical protein